jgi:hypothetical protein
MDPAARSDARWRRLLASAGAVVLAALTTPAAAMPLTEAATARADTRPRTSLPAFALERAATPASTPQAR